jgi:hypothetical protein
MSSRIIVMHTMLLYVLIAAVCTSSLATDANTLLSFDLPAKALTKPLFQFPDANRSISLGNWNGVLAEGKLNWPRVNSSPARFALLPSLLSSSEVSGILALVTDPSLAFDEDMDSVDQMTTHEFYVQRNGGIEPLRHINGKPDELSFVYEKRLPTREKLSAIMSPIIAERIVPFVNQRYSDACKNSCHVCQSLVRNVSLHTSLQIFTVYIFIHVVILSCHLNIQ